MRSLLNRHLSKARHAIRQWIGYPVYHNVNRADESGSERRALLVYLTKPFRVPASSPVFLAHQNLRQCRQIAGILGEFGYVVDVADMGDPNPRLRHRYDMVISHNINLPLPESNLCPGAFLAYLSSGMNHAVHNANLRRRLAGLRERRGFELRPFCINDEKMTFLKRAHAIIGFGIEHTMATWKRSFAGETYPFNNYAFALPAPENRDNTQARKEFLYFGSTNQVRKGLDLLLDVFSRHPGLHLHVAGCYEEEREFCRHYRKELYHTPNIHRCGWLEVGGEQWQDVVTRCAWTILPSCEEGQPGSVVQCMAAGLVPVVTRETGIEAEGFGFVFADDSIPTIERTVLNLAEMAPDEVAKRSAATLAVTRGKYSEATFLERWREILRTIHSKMLPARA